MALLDQWNDVAVPVVGMLHCPPLPGSPRSGGQFDTVLQFVLRDAEALRDGGVDGLMLENFGDAPFFPDRVPAVTVAAMAALATSIRERFDLPLGINILRNDGRSALAVAAVCNAAFIRVNVLAGARVTDQGLLQGIAHDLLRERAALGCSGIRILADVDVKHSAPVSPRPIDVETRDLVERALADAVIVSGQATGHPTDTAQLAVVQQSAHPIPVFVGSGVREENVVSLIQAGARGLIVGNAIKFDGILSHPVDPQRVRNLVRAVRSASANAGTP